MNEATTEEAKTAENGSTNEPRVRSAYVSAPKSLDTTQLRTTLASKGVRAFSPDELDLPGRTLTEVLRQGMERADLVVGLVGPTPDSSVVFFELGLAQGLGKPTLALLTGDASAFPWLASGIPYLRFDPAQPTGLEFGLSQMLQSPDLGTKAAPKPLRRTQPLAGRADRLLDRLRAAGDTIRETEFEAIIAEAIRESGVTSVSPGRGGEKRIDLAVWSDDLAPWIDNPLLIGLRPTLRTFAEVRGAVGQFVRAMAGGDRSWGLLIYLRADSDVIQALAVPNVLCLSAAEFLGALRGTSFGDLVRRLRNQRVHGGS